MHFWASVLSHHGLAPKLIPQTSRRQGQVSSRDHPTPRELGEGGVGHVRPCLSPFSLALRGSGTKLVQSMSFQCPSKDTCFF